MKLFNFLQAYLGSNKNVNNLDIWVQEPDIEDGDIFQLKPDIRNYILFGDYYVVDISVDWDRKLKTSPVLSMTIAKEKLEPFKNCSFAYIKGRYQYGE